MEPKQVSKSVTNLNFKRLTLWVMLLWVMVFMLTALTYYLQMNASGSPRSLFSIFFGDIQYIIFFIVITLVLVWHISIISDDLNFSKKILRNWFYLSVLYMSITTIYRIIFQVFFNTPELNWLESIKRIGIYEHLFHFLFLQLGIGFSFSVNYINQLSLAAMVQEKMRADLAEVELNLTKAQFSPHFLFNSLNAISGLIRSERPTDALSALRMIRDMLREVSRSNTDTLVPFQEEWSFLQAYLSLQQLRFGQKLQLSIKIPESLNTIMWPRLTLQPLLENAILYGVDEDGNIPIEIVGCIKGRKVKITIRNLISKSQRPETFTGLGQGHVLVKKRLALVANKNAKLKNRSNQQYYSATVELNV
ncbi:MAG: histidine kinase [Marinicella sp.]